MLTPMLTTHYGQFMIVQGPLVNKPNDAKKHVVSLGVNLRITVELNSNVTIEIISKLLKQRKQLISQ